MTSTRSCPICQSTTEKALLFQKETIDKKKISLLSYASRKEPEFMCHQLLRCTHCDLVYASNPPAQNELGQAYHVADYDSAEEAHAAAETYMQALQPILVNLKNTNSVLEIGTGTGILLEHLKNFGFRECVGVEPSAAAIAVAPAHRRHWIKEGVFKESDFAAASFDLICCFMTMEHVHDPLFTALAAKKLLRPGGIFITITHNYKSLINRLLGKRSPIIDIEHLQLFSKISIGELFKRCGFNNVSIQTFFNSYSFKYWLRLTPLPKWVKHKIQALSAYMGIDTFKIKLNVGNIMTTGFRLAD
jgi:SAM-dependent methyltransferase